MASMHLPMKFSADIFIQSGVIDIFPKLKMEASWICLGEPWNRYLGFVWVSHGTTHEASFVMRTSCKNFILIG